MNPQKIITLQDAIQEAIEFYEITDCEKSVNDKEDYIKEYLLALIDDGYIIK